MYLCNNILRRLHSEVCIKLTLMHTLTERASNGPLPITRPCTFNFPIPYAIQAMFPFYKRDVALKVVNMHN